MITSPIVSSAPIYLADPGISTDSKPCYAARIDRQSSNIGSGQSNYAYQSYAARITMPGPGIDNCTQPSGRPDLSIYKETSTNPLPSGNGFVGAPLIARLQHGHVTPPLKEKLHHG